MGAREKFTARRHCRGLAAERTAVTRSAFDWDRGAIIPSWRGWLDDLRESGVRVRGVALLFVAATVSASAGCSNPWIRRNETVATSPGRMENRPSRLVAGNYCGFGTRTGDLSVPPVDRLDAACLDHDVCFTAGGDRCECNSTLAAEAEAVISDPGAAVELRRKAWFVRGYLAVTWPMCRIFPDGVLPPRKKDILKTRYRPEGQGE